MKHTGETLIVETQPLVLKKISLSIKTSRDMQGRAHSLALLTRSLFLITIVLYVLNITRRPANSVVFSVNKR